MPIPRLVSAAAVQRWAQILLISSEASRAQFAEIAQAAERLESPELVPVLLKLLPEDLKRRKRAQEEWLDGRCQTNWIGSEEPANGPGLSGCKLTPLGQGGGSGLFENIAAVEMAFVAEMVMD